VDRRGQAGPIRRAAKELRAQRGNGPHRALFIQSAAQEGEKLFLFQRATARYQLFGLVDYHQNTAGPRACSRAEFVTELDQRCGSLLQPVEEVSPGALTSGVPERRLKAACQIPKRVATWQHRRNDHQALGQPVQPGRQSGT
jgi:hypothetical protein